MKSRLLCFTLVASLVFTVLAAITAIPSYAQVKSTAPSSVYTINWIDAAGHIVKTWHGSKAEAAKIKQTELVERHKLQQQEMHVMQVQRKGKIHPFINRVYSCGLPNDFFDLFNEGIVCFANAGSINVTIFDVYEVSSGNNHGQFSTYVCGSGPCTGPVTIYIGWNTTDFPVRGYSWIVKNIDIY